MNFWGLPVQQLEGCVVGPWVSWGERDAPACQLQLPPPGCRRWGLILGAVDIFSRRSQSSCQVRSPPLQNDEDCRDDTKPPTLLSHSGVALGSPVLRGLGEKVLGDQRFVMALLVSQGRHSDVIHGSPLAQQNFPLPPFLRYFFPAQLPVPALLLEAVRG